MRKRVPDICTTASFGIGLRILLFYSKIKAIGRLLVPICGHAATATKFVEHAHNKALYALVRLDVETPEAE
jgi:hypothetical protein